MAAGLATVFCLLCAHVAASSRGWPAVESKKTADLDALDAAAAEVDGTLPKEAGPAAHVHAQLKAKATVEAAQERKAKAAQWKSQQDLKKTTLGAAHARDFTVSDSSEDILAQADALAHKLEEDRRAKRLRQVAPAKVTHVAKTNEQKAEKRELESAHKLETDVVTLQGQQGEVQKKKEAAVKEDQEESEEKAELGVKAKKATKHAPKKADLGKLKKIADEARSLAKAQAK